MIDTLIIIGVSIFGIFVAIGMWDFITKVETALDKYIEN